jgi:hypothetical protein
MDSYSSCQEIPTNIQGRFMNKNVDKQLYKTAFYSL